jgi:membrane carboxypeptidase/penicillin-binding protein
MFFGKPVRELNDVECAMIVGSISNPLIYSPLSNLNNSVSKTRRIMQSTVDAGFLTAEQADYQYQQFLRKWDVKFDKDNRAVSSLIGSFTYSTYRVNRAPFFNEHVRRQLTDVSARLVVKVDVCCLYHD